MRISALAGAAIWVALAGTAAAKPGELIDDRDAGALTVLDVAAAPACAIKSGLCLRAGHATVAVASAPVALVGGGEAAPASGKQAPVVPRFARANANDSGEAAPWTLELAANLKKPAWSGNALFVFFDMDDPGAIENRQTTALYQATVKAGPKVAARLALSPDEGFRVGHTYRIRVIQLIKGKEILLAEGDVALQ
jgi:hypothetical protein